MPCDDNRFDRENVAEEIEDLGKSERNAVRSQVRRIIEHLLKLPIRRPAIRAPTGWPRSSSARAELERTACRRRCVAISTHRCRACTAAHESRLNCGLRRYAAKRCRRGTADRVPLHARPDTRGRLVPRTAGPGGNMTRDFVGYGAEPPHARWPGEARVAVNFVINFEEGSELSYPAGDGVSETGLIESASTDAGNRRDLAAESMFEYGSRVGWWRLHRIFTRYRLPVTLFACARALEANPPAAAAIAASRLGHLRPRLSLDQALRARRGRGARPDRARRRADPRDHRQADRGLVLPLCAVREHAAAGRRAWRVSLRQRRL